ncbi:hypothetical protein C8R44DRAFT_887818 [Mycena epipterygia]|nr:hypothetical protein C8R44DRAFT_887818 [Mycena epipterygia]
MLPCFSPPQCFFFRLSRSPPTPLSSSLEPISRTVAPIRALTCTAPHASQARPVNCLNCSYPRPLFTQLMASACPRPVRCHICKGEGHIASACSMPTFNLVQRWCVILRVNNHSQMNMAASTAGQATPPRFARRPSSAVHAVASVRAPMPTRSVPTAPTTVRRVASSSLLSVLSPALPLSSTRARIGLRTPDSALPLTFNSLLNSPRRTHLPGHMDSGCSAPTTNPNFMRGCFNCGETGHTAAACTVPTAPMKCHACSGEGHCKRASPNPGPQRFFNCRQPQHIVSACVDGNVPKRLMCW